MRLKKYQEDVISDLSKYVSLLAETQNPAMAYRTLWEDKGVIVGPEGMDNYKSSLDGAPQVCIKVPTGGGKTFIAANAIKPIFDSMPNMRSKAVVWLVPSDAILSQTLSNLSNPDHPYRQKIDVDFAGRTEVYTKEQLLNGQNFNPCTVAEQLSVFVLSYDSFRSKTKEGRKAFKENGYLGEFAKINKNSDVLLDDIDETALIQVIRSLNPVIIVDESHHATSDLSVEMLSNFNPCFVLDLTATPKKGSNIISFVDAAQLKKENMVKLPVIVYNRKSQNDVFVDAITLRRKLEFQAKIDEEKSGRYIRPIVLFQAESNTSEDSTTYDKIKKNLVDLGIPEEHIAIKTGDKNELKNVELLSPYCKVRYIITVSALKEGWDCPFAYILATIANRSSVVDVEQILGRVLRLPYAKKNATNVLNLSYVITSSGNFNLTLEKVVAGLNNAGFSSKDYRAKEDEAIETHEPTEPVIEPQLTLETVQEAEIELPNIDINSVKQQLEDNLTTLTESIDKGTDFILNDEMFSVANEENATYETNLQLQEETAVNLAPQEVRDKMKVFKINEEFIEDVKDLLLPQFVVETEPSFFVDNNKLLSLDDLIDGFTLNDKDITIDFNNIAAEMARIDIDDKKDTEAKAWKLSGNDSIYFKDWFNSQPSEKRLSLSKEIISKQLSKIDGINDKERESYINRIVDNMTTDQIADFEQAPLPYILKIKDKIDSLIKEHRMKVFLTWLEQDKIQCKPFYRLKSTISPTTYTKTFPKSLYTAEEGNLNEYEKKFIFELSSMENVKWWHRNISRLGFQINGAVHAYPDLIVMLDSGKVLMVETKGDQLDNPKSKVNAKIGAKWAEMAGNQYKYYMVFEKGNPDHQGAYSLDRFLEIVRGM